GLDEPVQALERLGAVHLEAPVLLRLDDDDAGARDARVAAAQQPLLHFPGQRGGADIETQMHRVGDLVDVLAARALRAHRAELYLVVLDVDTAHRRSVYISSTGRRNSESRLSSSCAAGHRAHRAGRKWSD